MRTSPAITAYESMRRAAETVSDAVEDYVEAKYQYERWVGQKPHDALNAALKSVESLAGAAQDDAYYVMVNRHEELIVKEAP